MFSWVRLNHLAQWSKATFHGGVPTEDPRVTAISTDSRSIKPGETFLALRGEKFDGHDYIADVVKRGAGSILCERPVDAKIPVLVVPDGLQALAAIATHLREKFHGKVIAITGSAGKSSTKDMVAAMTGPHTVKSPASFNNLLGVSKTLCLLEDNTKFLVLEMGMNAFGEIKTMCDHFRPHLGAITNIGDAHIGKLGGQAGIKKAKKELFDYLSRAGAHVHAQTLGVALNIDDPLVVEAHKEAFRQKVRTITYSGEGNPADVTVREKLMDPTDGFLYLRVAFGKRTIEHRFPIFGMHHAQNLVAAMALSSLAGIQLDEIKTRLDDVRPALHRGEMFRFADDRVLIDESYNSNPSALHSALNSLCELDPARRRVMVIGEMREMDSFAESVHREAGEHLAKVHAAKQLPFVLVGVGALTKHLLEAVKARLPQADCHFAADYNEARTLVKGLLAPHDLLFIKGSRGVQLDRVAADYRPS